MEMCALHIMMIKQGAESEETQIKQINLQNAIFFEKWFKNIILHVLCIINFRHCMSQAIGSAENVFIWIWL